MANYLGTMPLTVDEMPERTPFELAMIFIEAYGQIDGAHHKQWVLDQVARIFHGTPVTFELAAWDNGETELRYHTGEPSEAYNAWVLAMKGAYDEDEECFEYGYDEGIAPRHLNLRTCFK